MPIVPFKLPDHGLTEVQGSVYLDDEFLVFEVEKLLLGAFDQDREVIKVEPSVLEDISFQPGLFRHILRIRPRTIDLLRAMPGSHGGTLDLRIARSTGAKSNASLTRYVPE